MVIHVRPHPLQAFDSLDNAFGTDAIQIKQGVSRPTARNSGHGQHTHGDPSLLRHSSTDSLTHATWNYQKKQITNWCFQLEILHPKL